MSRLSRSWPIAGRAFARASLTPKLLAVLAFSFVVAGAGVLTYAQALPGLAAQSPLLQMMAGQGRSSGGYVPWGPLGRTERTVDGEPATASADGSLAQTEGGMAPAAAGGSDAGTALPGTSALAAGGALGLSLPTGGSGGPLASLGGLGSAANAASGGASAGGGSSSGTPSSGGASSSGSGSGGASADMPTTTTPPEGSAGSTPDPAPAPAPKPEPEPALSPEQGGPVPEAMEAQIHQVLVEELAGLQACSDKAWSRIKQYESLGRSTDYGARKAAAQGCVEEIYPIHERLVRVSDRMRAVCNSSDGMQVWSQSRWYGAYVKMTEAYSRLETLMSQLSQAWEANVRNEDPNNDVQAWSAHLPYSSSTGNPVSWDQYRKTAAEIRL